MMLDGLVVLKMMSLPRASDGLATVAPATRAAPAALMVAIAQPLS
jgi:hypothetical protein